MLMFLDVVLTIVSTLCALGLLLLGILLLLGRLPLRLSRRTRSRISQLLGRSSARTRLAPPITALRPEELVRSPSLLPVRSGDLPPDLSPSNPLRPTFADGIAPPETPISSTQSAAAQTQAQLLIQLLWQLEGDVDRRDRLIKYAKYRHPGQSDIWYLEKVVHDLARDRSREPGRGTPT